MDIFEVITLSKEEKYLAKQLLALFEHMGVPFTWINADVREMADNLIATIHSKSILGNMNDSNIQIEAQIHEAGGISPLEMSINFN